MASSLHPKLTLFSPTPKTQPTIKPTDFRIYIPVRCGPRDNRGPLVRGRVLSKEAIQAVQFLKRSQQSAAQDSSISKTLSRLIKSDLIATFKELVRQAHPDLALQVLFTLRSEYQPELSLYADLISALAKKKMWENIDRLISDFVEREDVIACDDNKGLVSLLRALLAADRAESTVAIYRMMERSGWGSTYVADEHAVLILIKGLRRLGENGVADEIELEFGRLSKGSFGKLETATF
ncbi:hypothetical protein RJ641_024130 [Dillenia turbinata]|uniref:Uncharacterized protein n=1 Tax=Dillenia turbinata TaxID=194707 RepID=A0AAN8UK76_9MAGN